MAAKGFTGSSGKIDYYLFHLLLTSCSKFRKYNKLLVNGINGWVRIKWLIKGFQGMKSDDNLGLSSGNSMETTLGNLPGRGQCVHLPSNLYRRFRISFQAMPLSSLAIPAKCATLL